MPYATNPRDGIRIYFEDEGGGGDPVVLYGGILDSVEVSRESVLARRLSAEGFRLVLADHRGLGRSDKPHDVAEYAMERRVTDAVALLDALGMGRAHFVGTSYGGRLCFGIGQHVPDRVLSLIVGGQQPFAMSTDGALGSVISAALDASRRQGTLEPFLRVLEESSGTPFPEEVRSSYLDNDPGAVAAASAAMLADGDVATDLASWDMPCLLLVGDDDDFLSQARRASEEIPGAALVVLRGVGHVAAHSRYEEAMPAVLETLRAAGPV